MSEEKNVKEEKPLAAEALDAIAGGLRPQLRQQWCCQMLR